MAERGEESPDSSSPSSLDSCEDFESPSPSSSSEESANEDEPSAGSISRPSDPKRKKNNSQPRSTGKVTGKQQQKKKKKQDFSLNNDEISKAKHQGCVRSQTKLFTDIVERHFIE